MHVPFQRRGEGVEENLHAGGVGVGQDQGEGVVGAGLDRRVDVGIDIALIEETRRTFAALPPDMTDAALLADARLVLEIELQAPAVNPLFDFFQRAPGSF